jgi:DoxX-like family
MNSPSSASPNVRRRTTDVYSRSFNRTDPGDHTRDNELRLDFEQAALGRTNLSGVPALFLLVDGGMKLFKPAVVVQATLQLGYHESAIVGIGLALLASTLLYLIPRTAILGAVLLTGYLGGAVATYVRVGGPFFNIIFPVFLGALLWLGLWLRDRRLRELLPLRQQ